MPTHTHAHTARDGDYSGAGHQLLLNAWTLPVPRHLLLAMAAMQRRGGGSGNMGRLGALLAVAALLVGVLALVFTVGGGRDKAAARGGSAVGPVGGGDAQKGSGDAGSAIVSPLVGHEDDAAAAAAATAGEATPTTSSTTTKQEGAASVSTSTTATTNQGTGLLQQALANNPLLSAAGDPLQVRTSKSVWIIRSTTFGVERVIDLIQRSPPPHIFLHRTDTGPGQAAFDGQHGHERHGH